jgi:DNA-binding transcriptional MerR regulator
VKLYQRKQVAEITGLEPSNVQLYTDRGIVIPVHDPKGQGQARLYNEKNLVEILVCKKLIATGLTLHNVKFIMRHIRDQNEDDLFDPDSEVDGQLVITVGFTADRNRGYTNALVLPDDTIRYKMGDVQNLRVVNVTEARTRVIQART